MTKRPRRQVSAGPRSRAEHQDRNGLLRLPNVIDERVEFGYIPATSVLHRHHIGKLFTTAVSVADTPANQRPPTSGLFVVVVKESDDTGIGKGTGIGLIRPETVRPRPQRYPFLDYSNSQLTCLIVITLAKSLPDSPSPPPRRRRRDRIHIGITHPDTHTHTHPSTHPPLYHIRQP